MVRDTQNRPLVDVDVDDFVVMEAGRPRDVLSAHIADYPIAVLIDDGGAAGDFDLIRNAAARFITRLGQRAIAVRALTEPQQAVASFDDERGVLLGRVQALQANPGKTVRL